MGLLRKIIRAVGTLVGGQDDNAELQRRLNELSGLPASGHRQVVEDRPSQRDWEDVVDPPRASRGRRSPRSPVRFGLDELVSRSGLSAEALLAATPTYRSVTVPKRSGGQRVLRVPDPATKAIQRRLLHSVLDGIPIHPALRTASSGVGRS